MDWEDLRQAALLVKTLLENIGLAPFLKTTGGKGLHVVVPIEPGVDWDNVKGFSKAVAEFLERTFPDRFTSKLLKISRRGKIFIDYLAQRRRGDRGRGVFDPRPSERAGIDAGRLGRTVARSALRSFQCREHAEAP